MPSPLDGDQRASLADIDFLARSAHRVATLDALRTGPHDRAALRDATGASSPTMGRIMADFEERRWLRREGRQAALTPLGMFVADRFERLCSAMETERSLRDVSQWLPREMTGFSVELFEDAVVSYPGPGYPYQPVERVTELIEGSDTMRGFGTTVVKSSNLEAACRSIVAGLDFEYVYSPEIFETVVAWNPERIVEAGRRANCTTFMHTSLPDAEYCGLGIYDDRVGLCCHDAESGALKAVVDTDAPAAREWAESVYKRYRDEARLIDVDALAESVE